MKCFKWLVMSHIRTRLPMTVDPLQFVYHLNCSTEDTIFHTLHLALTHLNKKIQMSECCSLTSVQISIPSSLKQLIDNLDLHLLTGRPQSGWISPGLCAQPTAVYTANPRLHCHIQFKPHSNSLMRLTAVSHSTSYKEEVEQFTGWCKNSSRSLNIDQTKEMTADSPLFIKYINY